MQARASRSGRATKVSSAGLDFLTRALGLGPLVSLPAAMRCPLWCTSHSANILRLYTCTATLMKHIACARCPESKQNPLAHNGFVSHTLVFTAPHVHIMAGECVATLPHKTSTNGIVISPTDFIASVGGDKLEIWMPAK